MIASTPPHSYPNEVEDPSSTGLFTGKPCMGQGFSRGPESHGSMNVRKPGSIGATDAARVFKGVKMAGQMGARRTTVQDLKVVRVDTGRNLLLLQGSVPGPAGAVVMVRAAADQ